MCCVLRFRFTANFLGKVWSSAYYSLGQKFPGLAPALPDSHWASLAPVSVPKAASPFIIQCHSPLLSLYMSKPGQSLSVFPHLCCGHAIPSLSPQRPSLFSSHQSKTTLKVADLA